MVTRIVAVTALALLVWTGSAFGAGFALIEQGVKGLGNAFAGGAAVADDPSTVFFNPAGMTRLEGQQALGAVHIIAPKAKFDKDSATNALGAPLSGNEGGGAGVTGVAPNLYYTFNPANGWVFGVGVNAPFGLATEYNKGWVGRYHAVESDVKTVNINPSVAYKATDQLSLGFGVSAQYIDAKLSQMVDYGLFAAGAASDPSHPLFSTLNPIAGSILPTVSNREADIFSDIEADDWSYGFNLGALYEVCDHSRIGLAYRSQVSHELEGEADFDIPSAYLASQDPILAGVAASVFQDQGAGGEIDLPASASLSYYHRFNAEWAAMADVTWTEWSSFEKLVIEFDGSLASQPSVTTENWDDNFRYSVGTTFNPDEQLELRAGLAYDETPIPDAEHRTPRIPGEDRLWIAVGAGYKIDNFGFDFGYAHLFVDNSRINKTATPGTEDEGRGTLVGEFENSVDIASIEVSYRF
ncbi:MAG: hypothetical protein C0617_03180 [Desulfuromonas sp.]|uniref:OmpP1/FadL family transporter n=1 Tax=Desulfuromonas sp. TaxID=892 RepID=UPI000CC20E31|nr:outer membrane protein transport protein [Desulfuromonas sp.]PLX85699.1 MAG: hypothetical protein C0617_03180 [Desulfuromonas sp.]